MPPKATSKKSDKKSEEPSAFGRFVDAYRQLCKDREQTVKFKPLEDLITAAEEAEPTSWNFNNQPISLADFSAVCEALASSQYPNLKALRITRPGPIGDALVTPIVKYLVCSSCKLEELVLSDARLSVSGCANLAVGLSKNKSITSISLDFNSFGSEGLSRICAGLAMTESLRSLSLRYCAISGTSGARALLPCLLFIKSNLEVLDLEGNDLKLDGVMELIACGLQRARKLKSIKLAGNGIVEKRGEVKGNADAGEDDEEEEEEEKEDEKEDHSIISSPPIQVNDLSSALVNLILTNTEIEEYELHANLLSAQTVTNVAEALSKARHVKAFTVPTDLPSSVVDLVSKAVLKNKGKKKKGKSKK